MKTPASAGVFLWFRRRGLPNQYTCPVLADCPGGGQRPADQALYWTSGWRTLARWL